jgi:hypothetical protein
MAVLSGREIRRRHLQKTVEPVKYPRRRTRNQPAFRIAGKNKLTPEEQVVYDAFMEASNGLTREIADDLATGRSSGEWSIRFAARFAQLVEPLKDAAIRGGEKGFVDTVKLLRQRPDSLTDWEIVKAVAVEVVEPTTGQARRVAFNSVDPEYARYAENRAGELVTGITDSTRTAIRNTVADAYNRGIDVNGTSRRITEILGAELAAGHVSQQVYAVRGLTPAWAAAVDKRYAETFEQAVNNGVAADVASKRAAKTALRYGDKLRRSRGRTIARTEIMRAANYGRKTAMDNLAAQGLFDRQTAGKRWVTSAIDVCPICINEGGRGNPVRYDETFDMAGVDFPPAHSNCRCTWVLVPNFLARDETGRPTPRGETVSPDGKPVTPDNFDTTKTGHQVRNPDGSVSYSSTRVRDVHDPFVNTQMSGSIPRGDDQVVTVLGGGPASGKSSAVKSGQVRIRRGTVTANADDAKDALPEMLEQMLKGNDSAAAFVHEESSDLAKRLLNEALESGSDVVLDGTGDGSIESLIKKIENAREHAPGKNTKVIGEYVTLDTDEALRRAKIRGAKPFPEGGGRHVPDKILEDIHESVSRVFPQAADIDLYDELRLFDNNVPFGDPPILVYEKIAGQEPTIFRPDLWDDFLRKNPDYVPPVPASTAPTATRAARHVDDAVSVIDDIVETSVGNPEASSIVTQTIGDPIDIKEATIFGNNGEQTVQIPVNNGLLKIREAQGFNDLPEIVTHKQLDELLAASDDALEMVRGEANELFAESLLTGDFHTGAGIYGDGQYFDSVVSGNRITSAMGTAHGYADNNGRVVRAVLRPDARTISHVDNGALKRIFKESLDELRPIVRASNTEADRLFHLENAIKRLRELVETPTGEFWWGARTERVARLIPDGPDPFGLERLAARLAANPDLPEFNVLRNLSDDAGNFATMMGYDAIVEASPSESFVILLNRNAVVFANETVTQEAAGDIMNRMFVEGSDNFSSGLANHIRVFGDDGVTAYGDDIGGIASLLDEPTVATYQSALLPDEPVRAIGEMLEHADGNDITGPLGSAANIIKAPGWEDRNIVVDLRLQQIRETQGFNALPQVVPNSHLDEILASSDDALELFRGEITLDSADELLAGEFFPGQGIYGKGQYFDSVSGSTTSQQAFGTAEAYANQSPLDGVIVRAVLRPDARTLTGEESQSLRTLFRNQLAIIRPSLRGNDPDYQALGNKVRELLAVAKKDPDVAHLIPVGDDPFGIIRLMNRRAILGEAPIDAFDALEEIAEDTGWLATLMGYDAILVGDLAKGAPASSYVAVLNRQAIVLSETVIDSKAGAMISETLGSTLATEGETVGFTEAIRRIGDQELPGDYDPAELVLKPPSL